MFAPSDKALGVDVHHLVPQRWSRVASLDEELRGRITHLANLTPLSRATNRRISNHPPARYLSELDGQDAQAALGGIEAMLQRHLVDGKLLRPIGDDVHSLDEHVEAFLDDRQRQINEAFVALLGRPASETNRTR
jgi:hypothetical protein